MGPTGIEEGGPGSSRTSLDSTLSLLYSTLARFHYIVWLRYPSFAFRYLWTAQNNFVLLLQHISHGTKRDGCRPFLTSLKNSSSNKMIIYNSFYYTTLCLCIPSPGNSPRRIHSNQVCTLLWLLLLDLFTTFTPMEVLDVLLHDWLALGFPFSSIGFGIIKAFITWYTKYTTTF